MLLLALLVGVGAGLGAVAFRYLINFVTWLATGHSQFGQAGYVGSSHLPWLGLGFFVVIPVIGGLLYGPLIYKWAREARGHGVPEVMIADAVAIPFLGDKPFLSGFPAGITLQHPRNYLLVAVLAMIAALMGLAFKNVLYKIEDWCDALWKGRPEWARPVVLGLAFGLLLLALPQMYGVGYPVMFKATAGGYAVWFLVVLAFGKILATSVSMGIGGSGGIFAPSLFIGVTTGMPTAASSITCSAPEPGSRRSTRWSRWARCSPPPPVPH
jgi:H+/Cl- antiporter ClcA